VGFKPGFWAGFRWVWWDLNKVFGQVLDEFWWEFKPVFGQLLDLNMVFGRV
jgi:hypothetical protein